MARTQRTVVVSDIADILANPERGIISLVGDHGGLSLITGSIDPSSLVMGTTAIETEHGVVYLDPDSETRISEDDQRDLDARIDASIYTINDILTSHLAERFDWYATDDDRYEGLNDLTHTTAAAMDDLLAEFSAEGPEPEPGFVPAAIGHPLDIPTATRPRNVAASHQKG